MKENNIIGLYSFRILAISEKTFVGELQNFKYVSFAWSALIISAQ